MRVTGLGPVWYAIAIAWVLVLVGCATSPRIVTNSDPQADFSTFTTFTFETPLATDRPSGTRTLLSQCLVEAALVEMQNRGYVAVDTNADLTINFYVSRREKLDVRQSPTPVWRGYYDYRFGHYAAWRGYETSVNQYTEGTLNVDVIDTREDQLVWEGAIIGRVRDLDSQELKIRVQAALHDLFLQYPYRAGSTSSQ